MASVSGSVFSTVELSKITIGVQRNSKMSTDIYPLSNREKGRGKGEYSP
jgi:hypothetical protein